MTSKWLPKPSGIHPRSDPEPYQKIDVFLEGLPGGFATNSTMVLHWIWLGKGEEKERVMPKTPLPFLGKVGRFSASGTHPDRFSSSNIIIYV